MVRDLMINCRHLILFLVVQKILASLKLTTVFTVTTECISQNGSEKKFQLQPGIIIREVPPDVIFGLYELRHHYRAKT